MKKVSIIVYGQNQALQLPVCLQALQKQDYWNREIIYLDNASEDESVELVQSTYPEVEIVALKSSLTEAAAYNLGICLAKGDYVLVVRPNVYLRPDYLGQLVAALDANPALGGVQGKIFQTQRQGGDLIESSRLVLAGWLLTKARQIKCRGEYQEDSGQFDQQRWIFAPCPGASLYRLEVFEQTKQGKHFLDDVFQGELVWLDLAWQARLLGWEFALDPAAMVFAEQPADKDDQGIDEQDYT
ncbi:MAG TPA: glycosyltransferase, partial [Candidatus Wirthbacteria bacterium]|nr:glycosyltransferase [Candidatus Wirthbacteria bacterium]